jgi:hypothetical protein
MKRNIAVTITVAVTVIVGLASHIMTANASQKNLAGAVSLQPAADLQTFQPAAQTVQQAAGISLLQPLSK